MTMEIEYTNFCFKKVIKPEQKLKNIILKNVYKHSYIHSIQRIEECKNLKVLNEHFLISENIENSSIFLLYLTTINKTKYTCMVEYNPLKSNEDINVYLLFLRFDIQLYEGSGTLFYGDLTYNKKDCWNYLISDIILFRNKPVFYDSLFNKIMLISEILKKNYSYDDFMNPFHIKLRSFMTLNHIDIDLFKDNTKIIFYPNNSNMNKLMITIKDDKEEYKEEIQKEYLVEKDKELPDIYKIYTNEHFFIDIMTVKTIQTSKYLRELFKDKTSLVLELENIDNEWILKE